MVVFLYLKSVWLAIGIGLLANPGLAFEKFTNQSEGEDVYWVWHSANMPQGASSLAILLDHIVIDGPIESVRKRRRALYVPTGVPVTPVVHVQMSGSSRLPPTTKQTRLIVDAVLTAANRSTSGWVQLDFEIKSPLFAYYSDLVKEIRRELPRDRLLSIPIQAHWCLDVSRMEAMEADELVPMFFHTGDSIDIWWRRLNSGSNEMSPRCRKGAAGFSVQEPPLPQIAAKFKRRYWFSYVAWKS